MMPPEGDYWTITARADLLDEHNISTPQTFEELAAAAEYFNGRDLDGDGNSNDFGFCGKLLGPQPWASTLLYGIAAPYLQTHGKEQGLFFDAETLGPIVASRAQKISSFHSCANA